MENITVYESSVCMDLKGPDIQTRVLLIQHYFFIIYSYCLSSIFPREQQCSSDGICCARFSVSVCVYHCTRGTSIVHSAHSNDISKGILFRVLQPSELERLSLTAAESHNSATHNPEARPFERARFRAAIAIGCGHVRRTAHNYYCCAHASTLYAKCPVEWLSQQQQQLLLLQFARGS